MVGGGDWVYPFDVKKFFTIMGLACTVLYICRWNSIQLDTEWPLSIFEYNSTQRLFIYLQALNIAYKTCQVRRSANSFLKFHLYQQSKKTFPKKKRYFSLAFLQEGECVPITNFFMAINCFSLRTNDLSNNVKLQFIDFFNSTKRSRTAQLRLLSPLQYYRAIL